MVNFLKPIDNREIKKQNIFVTIGKLIKRQRLPKNDQGDNWHWKDLNNGNNATFYGKVFHIVNCDKFTKVSTCSFFYIGLIEKKNELKFGKNQEVRSGVKTSCLFCYHYKKCLQFQLYMF